MPVLWAVIFAVSLFPVFGWLKARFGGRGALAATLLTLVALAIIIVPTVLLSASTIETVKAVTVKVEDGTLRVPPPPAGVAEWPVVGEQLYPLWAQAAENLQEFIQRYREQLKPIWNFAVSQAASVGSAALMFMIAILIAGFLMAKAEPAVKGASALATRLAGENGASMVTNSGATIRSVVQGVLGVAFIQSLASGVAMLLAGVPGAGLWAGLVLILAIMQLPPLLVLVPAMIYVFASAGTLTGVIFMVVGLAISASDAFLKPLLLGRGLEIPMPIILIGAIGGMILSGIVGLFIGAVMLALAYQLFQAWMGLEDNTKNDGGGTEPAPA
jgi:predicted PurR-regulated permease PerM